MTKPQFTEGALLKKVVDEIRMAGRNCGWPTVTPEFSAYVDGWNSVSPSCLRLNIAY
jgi:hypothetical protein